MLPVALWPLPDVPAHKDHPSTALRPLLTVTAACIGPPGVLLLAGTVAIDAKIAITQHLPATQGIVLAICAFTGTVISSTVLSHPVDGKAKPVIASSDKRGWFTRLISASPTVDAGVKELVTAATGDNAISRNYVNAAGTRIKSSSHASFAHNAHVGSSGSSACVPHKIVSMALLGLSECAGCEVTVAVALNCGAVGTLHWKLYSEHTPMWAPAHSHLEGDVHEHYTKENLTSSANSMVVTDAAQTALTTCVSSAVATKDTLLDHSKNVLSKISADQSPVKNNNEEVTVGPWVRVVKGLDACSCSAQQQQQRTATAATHGYLGAKSHTVDSVRSGPHMILAAATMPTVAVAGAKRLEGSGLLLVAREDTLQIVQTNPDKQ